MQNIVKTASEITDKAKDAVVSANPNLSETLLVSLVGFSVVFIVLVALMAIISVIGKVAGEKKAKPAPAAPVAPAPSAEPAEKVDSYTGVKLNGVADKDAALIMAIVASELDKPLDNLRFISIKEVK